MVGLANRIALVLGWNGPFYPLYVAAVAGWQGMPWLLLTICASPFFLAVPFVARRAPTVARVMLAVAGLGNTILCTWVMGESAGIALFLIPCGTLAGAVFRRDEKRFLLPLLAAPLVAYVALRGRLTPPHVYDAAAAQSLLSMNALSVGCLTVFMGYLIATTDRIVTPPAPTP